MPHENSEDKAPAKEVVQIIEIVTKFLSIIPQQLLKTPQGVGLFSIMIGASLKQMKIGTGTPSIKAKDAVIEGQLTYKFADDATEEEKSRWISEYGSEREACDISYSDLGIGKARGIGGLRKKPISGYKDRPRCSSEKVDVVVEEAVEAQEGTPGLTIDIFPFEIGGISPQFGELAIPDLLIISGFMANTSEFWKGIAEFGPESVDIL